MARKKAYSGRPLDILGNDLLYQICEIVSIIDRPPGRPDVKSQNTLLALSKTNRTLRELSLPFLFSEVKVVHYAYPQPGWGPYVTKLTKLGETTSIHRFVKTFSFTATIDITDKNQEPPSELPTLLTQILQRFTKLQSLVLKIPGTSIESWDANMRSADLMLPLITELSLGSSCEFMIPRCPNVRTIRGSGSFHYLSSSNETSFIKAALAAEKLVSLEIRGGWHPDMVNYLVSTPNRIENLSEVAPGGGISIEDVVSKLGRLSGVRSLRLAATFNLDIGFYPPRCGNAYMGTNGPSVWESVQRKGMEAEEKVARMVDAAFRASDSALTEFWIGDRDLWVRAGESKEGVKKDGKKIGQWVKVI